MPETPRGKGQDLDQFNDQLRANPEYRAFLRSMGVNPDGALRLSGTQRTQAEQWVRQRFRDLPGKFQIDPAGNINTDHGVSTAWSNPYFRYPLLAGGTVATMGALGAFSGAAGAAGSAGGAGGINAGVGSLGAAGLPGGAMFGAAAPAGYGVATGIGTGGGAGLLGGGAINSQVDKLMGGGGGGGGRNWITDLLFAGLPAVTGLFGANMASNASDRAAQIQADAFDRALAQQREMYDQDRADFTPYREAGGKAMARFSDLLDTREVPGMPASVQARLSGPGDSYRPVPIGPGIDPRTMQNRPDMYGTASSFAGLGRPVGSGQTPGAPANRPGPQTPPAMDLSPRRPEVSTTQPVPVTGGGVTLRTPGGQTFNVSEADAPSWEARGAKRVA